MDGSASQLHFFPQMCLVICIYQRDVTAAFSAIKDCKAKYILTISRDMGIIEFQATADCYTFDIVSEFIYLGSGATN